MAKEEDTFLFINFVLCLKNKTCQKAGLIFSVIQFLNVVTLKYPQRL